MAFEWWRVVVAIVCIILSGTFSGLTLGLMSLGVMDLRVLTESGTEREKKYARRILPVRKHGNFLLCTLLIGNTAVNSALSIVTADLFGGVAGFLASSVAILYIGEIIPQAVCYRYGLIIGAYAIPLVKLFMLLTCVVSYPTAKLLDCTLGTEPTTRYNKSQLRSLLSIHGTTNQFSPDASQHDVEKGLPGNAQSSSARASVDTIEKSTALVPSKLQEQQREPPQLSHYNQQQQQVPNHQQQQNSQSHQTLFQRQQQQQQQIQSAHSQLHPESLSNPSEQTQQHRTDSRNTKFKLPWFNRKHNHQQQSNSNNHDHSQNGSHGDQNNNKNNFKKDKPDRKQRPGSSTNLLTKEEMNIFGGAFDFGQKTVSQVMTPLDKVFRLDASLSLNFHVMLIIFQSGHSRVPVYENHPNNIIGVLFAKDLILLDPEDCVPIKTVLLFFSRDLLLVYDDTRLFDMLNIFKKGRGHLAIVQKVESRQNADPCLTTIGVVTLEDLIEELIGEDIVDETDVYTDNVSRKRVKRLRSIDPELLKMFDARHVEDCLTEKEVLVVASYLANNTYEFSEKFVRGKVLREMLATAPIEEYFDSTKREPRQPSIPMLSPITGSVTATAGATPSFVSGTERGFGHHESSYDPKSIRDDTAKGPFWGVQFGDENPKKLRQRIGLRFEDGTDDGPSSLEDDIFMYKRGVPTINSYLILSGRLEICAGADGFVSEAGPWTLLGAHALVDELYAPDFSARVVEKPARLLRITRRFYRLLLQYSGENPLARLVDEVQGKKPRVSPHSFERAGSRKGSVSSVSFGVQALPSSSQGSGQLDQAVLPALDETRNSVDVPQRSRSGEERRSLQSDEARREMENEQPSHLSQTAAEKNTERIDKDR